MSNFAYLGHSTSNGVNAGTLASGADNTFAAMTLNTELSDPDAIVSLSSNKMVFASTGTYQIDGQIAFGYDATMNGVGFRCGLYNVTSSAFVTQKGSAVEIIASAGVAPDPAASSANNYVQLAGRFDVANATDEFAIYGAGKSTASTWYNAGYAQGVASSGVTTGSKPELYKIIQITKE